MKPDALSGSALTRREHMLDAAETLFAQLGFKAVTMERIARACGHSKVTLYSYFPDKEQVFGAVADRLALRMEMAVGLELKSDAGLAARVTRALLAKERLVRSLVRDSPHAQELFVAKNALVRERFRAADRAIVEAMAAAIRAERRNEHAGGPAAARLARIVFDAATGLANAAASHDEYERNLEFAVARLLANSPAA